MAKDDEDVGFKRWVECIGDRWPPVSQTAQVLRVLEVCSSLDQLNR
ncbi:uncharacterized protein RSE6_04797 [Rhynchosporium secalis]|uniref:Uncharacterized protein n=1 Tax=Rhynchosporium secalis TaxID=38038 RepID=A0A1E1M669_RHYSE|nr:uncharacterized protein RSE6_04797 [Rhynchosporium secalis]